MGRQFGTISQNPNTCSDSTFLLPERNLFFRCILRKTERYLHKSVHFSLICNNQEDYKQAKCPQQIFAILWYIYINAAFKTNEGGLHVAIKLRWDFLVVQQLRICLSVQRMWVRSLVQKLRSHLPRSNSAHLL